MKLKVQLMREVLDGKGDKRVRVYETMEAELSYDGDGNVLTSSHPDKTFGNWVVIKKEGA